MFGTKFLNKFLILILSSQLLLNTDKAVNLINNFGKVNIKNTNTTNTTNTTTHVSSSGNIHGGGGGTF